MSSLTETSTVVDMAMEYATRAMDSTVAQNRRLQQSFKAGALLHQSKCEELECTKVILCEREKEVRLLKDELSLERQRSCKYKSTKSHLRRKVSKTQEELRSKREVYLKEKLANIENQSLTLNRTVTQKDVKLEDAYKRIDVLRFRLQEAEFEKRSKSKELSNEREQVERIKRELSGLRETVHKVTLQRNTMQQRAAVYRERLALLEKDQAPELIEQKYKGIISEMETNFAKQQKRLVLETQKALLAREEVIHNQYKRVAETAIDNAELSTNRHLKSLQRENQELISKINEIRRTSIPLELHDQLIAEMKVATDIATSLKDDKQDRLEKEGDLRRELNSDLKRLEVRFQSYKEQSEKRNAESSASMELLNQRLQDRRMELSSAQTLLDEKSAEISILRTKIEKMTKQNENLVSKLALASHDIQNIRASVESEKTDWAKSLAKHEIRIAELETEVKSKDEMLSEVQVQAAHRSDHLQGELAAALHQLTCLKQEHSKVLETMQTMLPEMKRSQTQHEYAEERAYQVEEHSRERILEAKQVEKDLNARLEDEKASLDACRQQLTREQQMVHRLQRSQAESTNRVYALEKEVAFYKQKLASKEAEYRHQLETKDMKYSSAVKRLERGFRLLKLKRSVFSAALEDGVEQEEKKQEEDGDVVPGVNGDMQKEQQNVPGMAGKELLKKQVAIPSGTAVEEEQKEVM